MEVGEGGRFCGACSKVVVDFSVMSDREILQYLSRARGGVCGRLGVDQVDREILLGEEKRRKWMGWGVLVAGLLFGSRGMAQQRPNKAETHLVPVLAGCLSKPGSKGERGESELEGRAGAVSGGVVQFCGCVAGAGIVGG